MILTAVIEIPKGSNYKYELKSAAPAPGRILTLDRVVMENYPHNYGYITTTLCPDGDALDVFVVSNKPIYPGAYCKIVITTLIKGTDDGVQDDKLIATLPGDLVTGDTVSGIVNFLKTYKSGYLVESITTDELEISKTVRNARHACQS